MKWPVEVKVDNPRKLPHKGPYHLNMDICLKCRRCALSEMVNPKGCISL
jgi:hypothetical protein